MLEGYKTTDSAQGPQTYEEFLAGYAVIAGYLAQFKPEVWENLKAEARKRFPVEVEL